MAHDLANPASGGWINGMLGVVIFSGSLPATQMAAKVFNAYFLTGARACIAGVLALGLLLAFQQKRPAKVDLVGILVVAGGAVIGFPLLTALALHDLPTPRAIAYAGLLPLATALFGVLRGGERPHPGFWFFAGIGSAIIAGYMLSKGFGPANRGDLYMLAAILICGLAYAEGARLSARLGGWQVVCWSLVISLPVMVALMLFGLMLAPVHMDAQALAGLGYVAIFSSLIGFMFWYRGLAQGGVASVGQLQLLQPFFGLVLAALLLHDPVRPSLILATAATGLCVAAARRFSKVGVSPRTVRAPSLASESAHCGS